MMCIKKRSDGQIKVVEGSDTGEPFFILCGVDSNGTARPLLCDETGKLIMTS